MPDFIILQAFDFFIFSSATAFLIFLILVGGIAGLLSKSLAVGSFGAFIVFTHIAINTDVFIFTELLYAILTISFLFMSFRIVSYALSQRGAIQEQ